MGQVTSSLGVAKAWPTGQEREEAPAFWPPQSSAFVFSLCFPSACIPTAFQASPDCVQSDKRADEREISGGSGATSFRAQTWWRWMGGWGGAWRVTRLTTSCTESFLEGRFAHGSQNARSNPGKKVQLSPILQRKRLRSQKVGA